MPVPPQEAQELKQAGILFKINPADVYLREYLLYPGSIIIANKADTAKKYTATFPKPSGSSDIVFRGGELWKDNPKAKNLVYNYKDLAGEILEKQKQERAEEERVAEEKRVREKFVQDSIRLEKERIAREEQEKERIAIEEQRRKDMDAWAKRVFGVQNKLVFRFSKRENTITFEAGKPMTSKEIFAVNSYYSNEDKKVEFVGMSKKEAICYIEGQKVCTFTLKGKGIIKTIFVAPTELGYGIFDVK